MKDFRVSVTALEIIGLLLLCQIALFAQPEGTNLDNQLTTVFQQRLTVLERNDFQAYAKFLDDRFMMVDDNGTILTKAALVELRHKNISAQEHLTPPREVRVRSFGNCAVMSYRTTDTGLFAGQEVRVEQRIIETYIQRAGRWLLAARAEVPIPNANRARANVDSAIYADYSGEGV